MSDDWQPGDCALCIKQGPWRAMGSMKVRPNEPIRAGMFVTVRKVGMNSLGYVVLWFAEDMRGDGPRYSYRAIRFVKLRPHQPDAEDAETIALLKGGRVLA